MIKTFLMILFSFLIFFSSQAQEKIQLWKGQTKDDYRKKKVFLYCFLSENKENKASIIFCPGGSYCYLAKENEGFSPAKKFRDYGFNTFVLIYRRGIKGNRYPAQIQDLQKAIVYVREELGFDSLGVCGFSAGGHLSGTSAVYYDKNFIDDKPHNLKPNFNIMIYPVVTMKDDYVHKKSRRNLLGQHYSLGQKDSMSLELNIKKTVPPLYILACKDDPIVKFQNSQRLADTLTNNGNLFRFRLFESGGHGFGINPNLIKSSDKSAAYWHEDFILWLKAISVARE